MKKKDIPVAECARMRLTCFARLTSAQVRCVSLWFSFCESNVVTECKLAVCTHCSANLPYLEALTGQESCVCSDCWSTVRVKLSVKANVRRKEQNLLALMFCFGKGSFDLCCRQEIGGFRDCIH